MTPAKVLVVDDEIIVLSVVEAILENCGCEITTATDGDQAIRLLESSKFDLVITDLQMGETNGFEVVKRAKELSPNTLIFMMTGCDEVEYAIAAFHSGAADYLLKPFSMQYLLERLQKKGLPISLPTKNTVTPPKSQDSLQPVNKIHYTGAESITEGYLEKLLILPNSSL